MTRCTPLPKAVKRVWANQLARLPCLVVYVKFQFVKTTTGKIGCQLSMASTSSNVQLGRGFEKAFDECPLCRLSPSLVTYLTFHNELSDNENH